MTLDYHTLRNMDLNLLVVLDVLLSEASVTKASQKLGLTQSAVSHALARLRSTFNDKLLVRVGSEMQPTPRAESLKKDLRRLLSSLRRFMDEEDDFTPGECTRTFSLGLPDHMFSILAPLILRFGTEAPKAHLRLHNADYSQLGEVRSNEVGLTITPMALRLPNALSREPLHNFTWGVFMRKDHPATKNWNLDSWAAFPHIKIGTERTAVDAIDRKMEEMGYRRKVDITVSSFSMVLPILSRTDYLFTSFRDLFRPIQDAYPVEERPVPFDMKEISFGLVWSSHLDKDPAKIWFQNLLVAAFQECLRDPIDHVDD
ncbi:MAG: LysR family transcriptional regulator, partial [Myxococcota bacterium]|nr:LysR family transcriptional regulator [Myxococcota bacterium]